MAHGKISKRSKAKTILRLSDLEQSKNTVLYPLGAASSQEYLSLAHAIRLLRLQHEIVELRHKRRLIRARVIAQWFCPFNQYLLRIRAEHLDRLVDELFQRHCSGFLVAVH